MTKYKEHGFLLLRIQRRLGETLEVKMFQNYFLCYWSFFKIFCLCLWLKVFSLFFSSSFRISNLLPRSLMHFELTFVQFEGWGSDFSLLPMNILVFWHHLLRSCFSTMHAFGAYAKGQEAKVMQVYSGSYLLHPNFISVPCYLLL